MGIGFHEFSFLKYSQNKKKFDTLGILGRQENFLESTSYNFLISANKNQNKKYADEFLIEQLSLKKLVTFDAFDKENPTKIENFNHLFKNEELFDIFFDGGSLQHTFNVPNVLQNISNHVKEGGAILHVASSNNLCGFGFYQFSPEFFLNYYSNQNGFINTEIFVANFDNHKEWFKLKENLSSEININTNARLICLVRTEKKKNVLVKDLFQFSSVNEQEYTYKKKNKKKIFIKIYLKILNILDIFNNNLSLKFNKNLTVKKIKNLLS